MMRRIAAAIALSAFATFGYAAEKGYLGLSLSIEGEGASFNPTLKAAIVADVKAGSPAAAAGLAKGDELVEIEGRKVAGAKADDLRPYLSRNVGEPVRFKVKKGSGETVDVTLVAAPRP